jgi:hypothetical protein
MLLLLHDRLLLLPETYRGCSEEGGDDNRLLMHDRLLNRLLLHDRLQNSMPSNCKSTEGAL